MTNSLTHQKQEILKEFEEAITTLNITRDINVGQYEYKILKQFLSDTIDTVAREAIEAVEPDNMVVFENNNEKHMNDRLNGAMQIMDNYQKKKKDYLK